MFCIAQEHVRRTSGTARPGPGADPAPVSVIPYSERQAAELITLPALACSAILQSHLNDQDSSGDSRILSALAPATGCLAAVQAAQFAMFPINAALTTYNRQFDQACDRVSFWQRTGILCPSSEMIDVCIKDKVEDLQRSNKWAEFLSNHTELLNHAIAHTPSGLTPEELDTVIRPWLKAEQARSTIEVTTSPGFEIVGIRLATPDWEKDKPFPLGSSPGTEEVSAQNTERARAVLR